jgi:peptide/nickel transport system substrate-binding protein
MAPSFAFERTAAEGNQDKQEARPMKRAVFMLAALGIAVLVWAPTAPLRAETVLRIDEVAVGELDPMKAQDVADSILFYNAYDTLVFPALDGSGGGLQPLLAEKIDIDGTTYTITLRDGVKFHSGNVLDAEDVVFSLNRMIALGQGFSYLFKGWVENVVAKDQRTVVVTLAKPYAPFQSALLRLPIMDKDDVLAHKEPGDFGEFGDYGQAYAHTHAAGTGAYRVESHDPQQLTVMRKFDDYFLGHAAKAPDVVRQRYALKDPTILTFMSREEHDIANQWIGPETMRALVGLEDVTMMKEPGIAQYFIKLNNTKPPLDDVHCRKALAFALDYDAIYSQRRVSEELVGAKPSKGPLLESMMGYDPTMPDFARDMEKAKEELAQCKYEPGDHRLEITWIAEVSWEERIALLMQQNWGELGFASDVVRVPWVLFTERVTKPETTPHVGQLNFNARTPDPDAYLYNVYHSSTHGQYAAMEYFDDAEVDRLLDLGRSTIDPAKREEIYKQVVHRIVELQPSIYGFQMVNLYPKRDVVTVPTLEEPNMNTGLMGGNLLFRLMEMK